MYIVICVHMRTYLRKIPLYAYICVQIYVTMMKDNLEITSGILNLIAEIDEFKGAWRAFKNLSPERLVQLERVATIESVGSSTRIEGSKLTDKQVEQLLSGLQVQKFGSRDEQEVVGYAELMETIFQSWQDIPLTEEFVQQMHQILLKYSEKDHWHRGGYKQMPNHVVAKDENGNEVGVVLETASPFDTPFLMKTIVEEAQAMLVEGKLHPLLVIAMFIVSFLSIHPFQDGNGRISRVLTTYLLLKSGYTYVPFSSLESFVERNKKQYYLALRQTQVTLKMPKPNWTPWIMFFLQSLKSQKDHLEAKVQQEHILLSQQPEVAQLILDIVGSRGRVTISDLEKLTSLPKSKLRRNLEKLVATNQLRQNGHQKGTYYTLL
jgi:Fic family protein